MSRLLALAVLATGVGIGTIACREDAALRLVVERDTLTLFGTAPTRLPLHLVDRAGATVPLRGVQLTLAQGAALSVGGDSLICLRDGRTDVGVRVAGQSGSFVTDCRLGHTVEFSPGAFLQMRLGESHEIAVFAKSRGGARVRIEVDTVVVTDPTVAELRNGLLHSKQVGRTTFTIAGSGVRVRSSASITELVAADTVGLRPDEFRTWRLDSGRYEISVLPVAGPPAFAGLTMETEGAKCVRDSRRDDTIHCMVYGRGAVGVRNTAGSNTGTGQRTAFHIVRAP